MEELMFKESFAHVVSGIYLKVRGGKFFLMLFIMILHDRKKQLFSIYIGTDWQWDPSHGVCVCVIQATVCVCVCVCVCVRSKPWCVCV